MKEEILKELEAIKGMVLTWKASHLQEAPPDGGAQYLVEDFSLEIRTFVYPYVRRFYEMGCLNESETMEFLDDCENEVEDLRNTVG